MALSALWWFHSKRISVFSIYETSQVVFYSGFIKCLGDIIAEKVRCSGKD